jgi:hypothetical protein
MDMDPSLCMQRLNSELLQLVTARRKISILVTYACSPRPAMRRAYESLAALSPFCIHLT